MLSYRSTPEILDLANRVLEERPDEKATTRLAVRSGLSLPTVVLPMTPSNKPNTFAKIIELHRDEGHDLSNICILYRAHFQAMDLQMELSTASLFQITSGVRFFAQAHVKDLTSQLMFVGNSANTMAFNGSYLLPSLRK